MPRPFVVKNAKYLLLTYAQAEDVDPWSILNALTESGAECIIGRERHLDGGVHYHVFVDFGGKQWSTRNARCFDIGGHHPNIEKVNRTPWKSYDYAIKDGDVVCGGASRPVERDDAESSGAAQQWQEVVKAESREEFFALLEQRFPRYLVCSYPSVAKYADWRYREVPLEYCHPEEFAFNLDGYRELDDWVAQAFAEDGPVVPVRYVPNPPTHARALACGQVRPRATVHDSHWDASF